jgi:hypothetical protein
MSLDHPVPALLTHLRSERADSSKPLTATSNPRTFLDLLDDDRPSDSSSQGQGAKLRADRIGGLSGVDFDNGVLEDRLRGSLIQSLRSLSSSDLRGRSPGRNDQQDSTFPGGKCGRAAGAQIPPILRVSGTLRTDPPDGDFLPQTQTRKNHAS